jgi:hypothetical protein
MESGKRIWKVECRIGGLNWWNVIRFAMANLHQSVGFKQQALNPIEHLNRLLILSPLQ